MASHTQIGLDNVTVKDSVLKNTDLMALTFSYLPKPPYNCDDDSECCLLSAALTCKDFLDVALDALWETMHSWEPLLKLLAALEVENDTYVRANVHVFQYDLILFLGS